MKAEIVTFVRAYNYGAVLQCWALSKALGVAGRELSRGLDAIDEPLPWQQIEEKRLQMKEQALAYQRRAMEWEG